MSVTNFENALFTRISDSCSVKPDARFFLGWGGGLSPLDDTVCKTGERSARKSVGLFLEGDEFAGIAGIAGFAKTLHARGRTNLKVPSQFAPHRSGRG
jgi:hypothetical protein